MTGRIVSKNSKTTLIQLQP